MKKYLWLIIALIGFSLSYKVFADDITDKTDGEFVDNPPKPINSSFVGDISNSMVNSSYGRDDLQKKTDSAFVGENTEISQNSFFSGGDLDKDVDAGRDAPFAQEHSNMAKDGVFIGEDVQNKTDNTFTGDDYGK